MYVHPMSNVTIFPVWLQFPLYTLMVFDDWLNGVPVAYIITSSSKQPDLEPWMRALATKLGSAQEGLCAGGDWGVTICVARS
jgi:hypothetical protein